MKRKVRVGIMGLGTIGDIHIEAFGKVPKAEIAALCDTDPKKLAACEEEERGIVDFGEVKGVGGVVHSDQTGAVAGHGAFLLVDIGDVGVLFDALGKVGSDAAGKGFFRGAEDLGGCTEGGEELDKVGSAHAGDEGEPQPIALFWSQAHGGNYSIRTGEGPSPLQG